MEQNIDTTAEHRLLVSICMNLRFRRVEGIHSTLACRNVGKGKGIHFILRSEKHPFELGNDRGMHSILRGRSIGKGTGIRLMLGRKTHPLQVGEGRGFHSTLTARSIGKDILSISFYPHDFLIMFFMQYLNILNRKILT